MTQAEVYERAFWNNRQRNDRLSQLSPTTVVNIDANKLAARGLTDRIRVTFDSNTQSRIAKGEAFRRAIALGMVVDVVTSLELLFYFNPLSAMHLAFTADHGGLPKHRRSLALKRRKAALTRWNGPSISVRPAKTTSTGY